MARRAPKQIDPEARYPGISFSEKLYKRYSGLLNYGSRNQVVNLIVELFLDLVESYGEAAIGALAKGAIKFEIDWDKMKQKESRNAETPSVSD